MNLTPLEDRVIILQDEGKNVTETGIHIPDASVQKPPKGTIIKVGPGKASPNSKPLGYLVNDQFNESIEGMVINITDRVVPLYSRPFLEGDRVYFSRYAGVPVEDDGKEYVCMRFSDLISRL